MKRQLAQSFRSLAIAIALITFTQLSQAALLVRGGGTMVYDDVLDITILADWNHAGTSGYAAGGDGRMMWGSEADHPATRSAFGWIASLNSGKGLYGFNDWRLPTALNADGTGPCQGMGCAGSELGHLFYEVFGASAYGSIHAGTNSANLALFQNVQSGIYWTGDRYGPVDYGLAWIFWTQAGYQGLGNLSPGSRFYSVAVRDGDVLSVTEPGSIVLVCVALGAVGLARRRL